MHGKDPHALQSEGYLTQSFSPNAATPNLSSTPIADASELGIARIGHHKYVARATMLHASIFLDFNLPNSTTWFYFSFLLAIALFFKFSRFLSIRNLDVVTLFLLVPGMLLIQEGRKHENEPPKESMMRVTSLVGSGFGQAVGGMPMVSEVVPGREPVAISNYSQNLIWFGYLWLVVGSAYFLIRCLIDLALVSRPALRPNLNFGGLAWLAGALFVCLVVVAFRPEVRQVANPTQVTASEIDTTQIAVGRESSAFTIAKQTFGFWLKRTLAMLCHLAVVAGLIYIGARHFHSASAGMAAATFYLLLPYIGLHVGQAHHVWPMALIVWALALYRWPTVAGILLGIATVTAYFPILIVPMWAGFYWKRGCGRFLVTISLTLSLGLAAIGGILWSSGALANDIGEAMNLSAWQPWRVPTTEGLWTGVHWAYRIPIFLLYMVFVATTAFWPCPKNLAHLIALSAAVLIGIQFWYADQGGVYVLWYLPLLLLMVFRPNLSDRKPPLARPDRDWLVRFGRWLNGLLVWVLRLPPIPVRSR